MATNVKVVSTDLRQITIKVNPGTYLTEVLEQACKKFSLSQDTYLLKHNKRQLDLSNTFRSAGLVPGAKLELVAKSKSPSVLSIALQLPEPESKSFGANRATEKLPSDYTLWKVLRHFESQTFSGKNINITGRGVPKMINGGQGQLYYETPVLQVERRSFSTFVDFQKTLSQLGYNSGNVLIRLSFQKTDNTLAVAMDNITQYFQDEDRTGNEAEGSGQAGSSTTALEDSSAAAPMAVSEAMSNAGATAEDVRTETKPDLEAMDVDSVPIDPLAPVSIFSAPSSSTPAAASIVEPDEIYMPGIAHAQLHQHRLKTESLNKRLPSDQELEERAAAEAAKISAVKSIEIKVRFPDNTSAQWRFGPDAAGAMVYQAVRQVMAADQAPFKLVLPGAKGAIRDDESKLIQAYGLTVRTLVNLVWADSVAAETRKAPFLKQSAASRAQEVVVPEVPQGEAEDEPGPSVPLLASKQESKGEGSGVKKMPKWLKGLGGKK